MSGLQAFFFFLLLFNIGPKSNTCRIPKIENIASPGEGGLPMVPTALTCYLATLKVSSQLLLVQW